MSDQTARPAKQRIYINGPDCNAGRRQRMRQPRRNERGFAWGQSDRIDAADFARGFECKADLVGDMAVGSVVAGARVEQGPTDAENHRSGPMDRFPLQTIAREQQLLARLEVAAMRMTPCIVSRVWASSRCDRGFATDTNT